MDLSIIPIIIVAIYLISSIKILSEYERGVIFRLGRVLRSTRRTRRHSGVCPHRPDRPHLLAGRSYGGPATGRSDERQRHAQGKCGGLLWGRRSDQGCHRSGEFLYATSQVSQTTLRSILGEAELDEVLGQREKLNVRLQAVLDQQTGPWGLKVTHGRSETGDLPTQMIRAIARQRKRSGRRAKIIHATVNMQASKRSRWRPRSCQRQPAAIQLRYLQTWSKLVPKEHDGCVSLAGRYILVLGRHTWRALPRNGRLNLSRKDDGEFELVLGNRQLVSVFLIVVILLGVFFSMGYIVGRSSSSADHGRIASAGETHHRRELFHPATPLPEEPASTPPSDVQSNKPAPSQPIRKA